MLNLNEQYNILRGPYQLSLDITNNCNYRCLDCYIEVEKIIHLITRDD